MQGSHPAPNVGPGMPARRSRSGAMPLMPVPARPDHQVMADGVRHTRNNNTPACRAPGQGNRGYGSGCIGARRRNRHQRHQHQEPVRRVPRRRIAPRRPAPRPSRQHNLQARQAITVQQVLLEEAPRQVDCPSHGDRSSAMRRTVSNNSPTPAVSVARNPSAGAKRRRHSARFCMRKPSAAASFSAPPVGGQRQHQNRRPRRRVM